MELILVVVGAILAFAVRTDLSGLDLQVMELMDLPKNIHRTSVNFMGCYAAFNAMKLATSITESNSHAKVLIVCVELCSLHFQKRKNIKQAATTHRT